MQAEVPMVGPSALRAAKPFFIVIGVTILTALLIATITLTRLELPWVAFLCGILFAAVLAMVVRSTKSEWVLLRRSAQVAQAKERLVKLNVAHRDAVTALEAAQGRLRLVDDGMPAMLAYVDADLYIRMHNQAYAQVTETPAQQIDGLLLRTVIGETSYSGFEAAIVQARSGRGASFERTQKLPNGAVRRLATHFLPRAGDKAGSDGFYILQFDAADARKPELQRQAQPQLQAKSRASSTLVETRSLTDVGTDSALSEQEEYDLAFVEQATGWKDAGDRILSALEHDEFCLFIQSIRPLDSSGVVHYEILLRLSEEEQGLMPPGTFLPIAESFGLLPNLDRWVVKNALIPLASFPRDTIFFINLAGMTMADPDFGSYVEQELRASATPATRLCFEFEESDLVQHQGDATGLIGVLRALGCHAAITGFGRDRASFDLLDLAPVDFLKIDGGIVCNILRDPASLAKVFAINRVTHLKGILTVAEFVENDEIFSKLQQLGVDFGQGFGISRPRPLAPWIQ